MKTQATIFAVILLFWGRDVDAASIKSAQGARKVLTKFILSDDLAAALNNAQTSLTSEVIKSAKINSLSTAAEDLTLADVFFHIDQDTTVELTDLKLSNVPVVGIDSVKPNLEFLNMAVDLNLGSLEVGGSFQVASKSVLSVIPATTSGKFSLTLTDVEATGKVGLSLLEDSFTTINYDINYVPQTKFLSTQYLAADGSSIKSIVNDDDVIANKINRDLKHVLNKIIKKQFDNILCELSVDELIGDLKSASSYREHAKAVRAVANGYVDELLNTVHDYVVQNHVEEIGIPNIEASFSKEILWVNWHGEFIAEQGHVKNLASLQRTADVSLEFDENTGAITVFGSLGLGELQLGYNHYSAKFMDIGPEGSVGAFVGENSLFIKVNLVLAAEPVIGLQDFHIEYAKNINIEVTGLGILDWLVSNIATWVVGIFNDQIVGSLDGMLRDYVTSMLPSVDPNKYFS